MGYFILDEKGFKELDLPELAGKELSFDDKKEYSPSGLHSLRQIASGKEIITFRPGMVLHGEKILADLS